MLRHDASTEDGDTPRVMTRWLWLVGALVLTAGLLFGYDQGVISGALDGIDHSFSLSTLMVEVVTSWVTLGALVGALVGGSLADRLGRRLTIVGAALLFLAGGIAEAVAPVTAVLVMGRLIVGLGVGVASVAAPLYASEMAPARLRGRFISTYQFGITFGIFVAYAVDELLRSDQWRLMLGLSCVAGIALVVLVAPLTDTPRWYLKVGRRDDAARALSRVERTDTTTALAALESNIAEDPATVGWRSVFAPQWRRPLMIGLGLAVFQQITGINAIIYYADKIFAAAGFSSAAEQTAATTWAIGAVNVLATLVAVFFVDKVGRKPLLLTGLVGMGISLTVVGFAFLSLDHVSSASSTAANAGRTAPSDAGIFTLVALVVYVSSFAFSLGPIVWTMINEIYPRELRGRAVAIATAVNWFSAWLVSQFFLSIVKHLGESVTFWIFAALCAVCFVWIQRQVPETKGRTLEEIEQMWAEGG